MSKDDTKCRFIEEELQTIWPEWHVVKRLGGGSYSDVFQIYKQNDEMQIESAALKVIQINDAQGYFFMSSHDSGVPGNGLGKDTVSGNTRNGRNSGSAKPGEQDIPEVFMNEIRIMEELRGAPNIVSVDDYCFRNGKGTSTLYVRMELLTSLQNILYNRQKSGMRFSITEVLKVGQDICTALRYCEERGIIHSCIKPTNVFVDADGNYKAGDFGTAKRMEAAHPKQTKTRIDILYTTPEVYEGKPFDSSVDTYALGLILYQLVNNGRMPFLPTTGSYSLQDVDESNFRRLSGEPLPQLTGIRIGAEIVDAQLDAIIRKACSPNRSDRYGTAAEFYDILTSYEKRKSDDLINLITRPEEAGPVTNANQIIQEVDYPVEPEQGQNSTRPNSDKTTETEQHNGSSSRKNPKLVLAAALAAALIIFGFFFIYGVLLRGQNDSSDNSPEPQTAAADHGSQEMQTAAADQGSQETQAGATNQGSQGTLNAASQVEWPKGTVNVVLPYSEGSTIYTYCRDFFDRIEEKTGGTFDITCVPGDNGMVGALDFLGKEPDGYSILFNHTAASLMQEASGKFEYSFTDDFDNCATVGLDRSYVLCAVPSSDYGDLSSMIEYAKEHPGELRYCNVAGSMTDYAGRRLEDLAGIEFEDVNVGSAASDQIAALLDGRLDLAVFYYTSVADRIDAGHLICLGVMANERVDGIDAPTFKEQGYDVVSERKYEVKFPKGTDPAIIEYLSGLCKEVTEDPEYADVLKEYYAEPYYRDAAAMNAEDPAEVQEFRKYLQ